MHLQHCFNIYCQNITIVTFVFKGGQTQFTTTPVGGIMDL